MNGTSIHYDRKDILANTRVVLYICKLFTCVMICDLHDKLVSRKHLSSENNGAHSDFNEVARQV